jgi:hypothetical protein
VVKGGGKEIPGTFFEVLMWKANVIDQARLSDV